MQPYVYVQALALTRSSGKSSNFRMSVNFNINFLNGLRMLSKQWTLAVSHCLRQGNPRTLQCHSDNAQVSPVNYKSSWIVESWFLLECRWLALYACAVESIGQVFMLAVFMKFKAEELISRDKIRICLCFFGNYALPRYRYYYLCLLVKTRCQMPKSGYMNIIEKKSLYVVLFCVIFRMENIFLSRQLIYPKVQDMVPAHFRACCLLGNLCWWLITLHYDIGTCVYRVVL